ncbi:MAG: Gfo/Idh/MocA family oxidoreductase [Candidatus Nanopelagicales bacterium]
MTLAVLDLRLADDDLRAAVAAAGWARDAGITTVPPDDPAAVDAAVVLLVTDGPLDPQVTADLDTARRDRPLLLVGPTLAAQRGDPLAEAAGVRAGGTTPKHEVRVRPQGALRARGAVSEEWTDRVTSVESVDDDVDVHATANLSFADHPVLTYRPSTGIGTATLGAAPDAWRGRDLVRLLHRWLHVVADVRRPEPVGVGMVGYGAIGAEHARAVAEVPGLTLAAVADRDPQRLEAALALTPGVRTTTDADAVLADPDVGLVIVSTPPNSHAAWAHRVLDTGRHVVLEKPMALTAEDCDAVLAHAAEVDRVALVYQNRRFDPDFRVLQRLAADGDLGEVFHLEAFVGGYGHPCNYWHSDAGVSGGALFDWGSHVVDQVLALLPQPVEHVTGAHHKRVWHDVTNADHARLTIRFADGTEAEFVYSDLAAALKPRWYVLGTRGAVVGDWRQERVVARSPIGTLAEDVLAPADSPARMSLHHPDGSVTELAEPPAPEHAFHHDLADHLLEGMPMRVTPQQSRRVVAVLQAAEKSAQQGGQPVRPS